MPLIGLLLAACAPQAPVPPTAPRYAQELIMHGDTRIDFYYWMNQRENPEVIAYLEAENAYLQQVMAPTQKLQDQLFAEMSGRIKQDDSSAPYLSNGYYYYTRFETGGEYPIYCRKKGHLEAEEEIILNVPEIAKNYNFFSVGGMDISPNNQLMAFAADTMGRRQYTIHLKDLQSGTITPTGIRYAGGSLAWAADNVHLFYNSVDPVTLRYDRVFRLNTQSGEAPVEVYYEKDETYYYNTVSTTKDRKYITVTFNSTLSNEILILDAQTPLEAFKPFQTRERELKYSIEHLNGKFYVITDLNAPNFRLMETPAKRTGKENWKEVIAHRPDVLLESMSVFNHYLVLQERSKGLRQMRIFDLRTNQEHYLDFQEEAYTASIHVNAEMNTPIFRFSYTSLTTPASIYVYHMDTREQTLIKQQEVLGDFDPDNYQTRRIYVSARDGAQVPVTIVYHVNTEVKGNNPLLLYGYGSYGASMDPRFSSNLLSLLDRGFVYAMAHIRGGMEMGRQWYEDGKLLQKKNTFYDFIDVADYLVQENYTAPSRLFASGGSAGGLLMGAVMNMRPELFKGIIAGVPFVDVVTTMLDESIPLTTAEYDEWGNPNDPVYYEYMLSYSPYDQVSRQAYSNVLITSGLHDSQVQYFEPTKWAAKLREYSTGDNLILLHTNMEAGHGGASGRLRRLRQTALEYAFLLKLAEIRQ